MNDNKIQKEEEYKKYNNYMKHRNSYEDDFTESKDER